MSTEKLRESAVGLFRDSEQKVRQLLENCVSVSLQWPYMLVAVDSNTSNHCVLGA